MKAHKKHFANHMNLTTFNSLLEYCNTYNKTYLPEDRDITLKALTELKEKVETADKKVEDQMAVLAAIREERAKLSITARNNHKQLISALTSAKESQGKPEEDANPLIQQLRQIRLPGMDKREELHAGQKRPDPIALQMQIYKGQALWIEGIANQLENSQQANNLQAELQPAGLKALKAQMEEKNEALTNAIRQLDTLQEAKEKILYEKETGIIDLANKVKNYFIASFPPESAEYREVNDLKFRHLSELES